MVNDSVGRMIRSVWKDGENKNQIRRNSPRISALNASKETQQKKKTIKASDGAFEKGECHGEKQGPPGRERTRVKRKFSNLAAKHVSQGRSNAKQHEDQSTNNGIPSKLPEKRILQLVLDILQRKDAYEIFAEPVDPDEVKDYYEIIKKPMDFGTMRAKLHEGMYQNLEQFEHDAFLIPENAMNFNSPGTIYFRQARGIFDLAKKVFHVLKTDPENFEVEFSGTRRRSIRKLQNETKESSKPQKDVKPDTARAASASNTSLFCLGVPSALARSSKESPRFASMVAQTNNKDHVFFPGNGDAQTSRSAEASRRSTYITWKSSLENQCPKPAILSSELKVSYRESLTRFVEDLGPTAKRIATRKLQALQANITPLQTPSYQVPTAYATFKMPSFLTSNAAAATASDQKLPADSLAGFGSVMKLTSITKDTSGAEVASKQKIPKKTVGSVVQYKRNSRKVSDAEKRTQSRGKASEKQSEDLNSSAFKKISSSSSKRPAGSSMIVDTRKPDDSKIRPVVLALEQSSHANTPAELKTRSKRSTNTSCSSTIPTKSQNKPIPRSSCKTNGKAEVDDSAPKHQNKADKASSSSKTNLQPSAAGQSSEKQPMAASLPLISRFTFNMPFLKAQLNQMNPAAAQTWDSRLFEATTRIAPRLFDQGSYLRFGSVSTGVMNHASHQDEHQQIPAPRPFIYSNSSTNNAQSSWHSLAPPLDSDLSLQL